MNELANPEISYHTLPNSLRIAHLYAPHSCAEYCGIICRVGSRDELPHEHGLAHFVEHTIFKGTKHRRSMHIINRMESVGGELNAYTTKEETVIYSAFPANNLNRATELIADLIENSIFPESELLKEREVVADEINSYLDNPSEAVFDDFDDLLFANSSLGHNILGTEKHLTTFSPEICRQYLSRYYVPGNMVFFYAGPTKMQNVCKIVERHFGNMVDKPITRNFVQDEVTVNPIFNSTHDVDSHQAHTIVGARIPGLFSSQRYEIAMLTNILGGPGMNSILNLALREKRGLVYSVDASTANYSDAGAFTIYYGCDTADVKLCHNIINREIQKLIDTPFSAKKLEQYARQYIGQLTLTNENREQLALSLGRSVLYFGKANMPSETAKRILSVTPQQMLDVAQFIAPQLCSTLTLA